MSKCEVTLLLDPSLDLLWITHFHWLKGLMRWYSDSLDYQATCHDAEGNDRVGSTLILLYYDALDEAPISA
jgi:hypothetical protein